MNKTHRIPIYSSINKNTEDEVRQVLADRFKRMGRITTLDLWENIGENTLWSYSLFTLVARKMINEGIAEGWIEKANSRTYIIIKRK